MDFITLILSALAAGVAAGAQNTATKAVTDAYNSLIDLLKRKFAGKSKALETLADYETDPDTYEKPLSKALTEVIDPVLDVEIIEAANHLMNLVQQANIAHNQIINQGTIQGQVLENKGTISMNFGEPPQAR